MPARALAMPSQVLPAKTLARVIAVVGSDGSGKSTLTADLVDRLKADHPTAFIYLGQSSGNILRAIQKWPLIGPAIGRALLRKSERVHAANKQSTDKNVIKPPPDTLVALAIYLLSRWRYHKFQKVLAMNHQGILVIADRYPQAEVPGFYFDGPELTRNPGSSAIVVWLSRLEQKLYQRMASHIPALVIRLNVDAQTAHRRKPDHRLAMLQEKERVIPMLHFNGAPICDLDGRDDYPGVLDAALAAVRSSIA